MRACSVETGAYGAIVFKCAFETTFQVLACVRAAAETGAFEVVVFTCAFVMLACSSAHGVLGAQY